VCRLGNAGTFRRAGQACSGAQVRNALLTSVNRINAPHRQMRAMSIPAPMSSGIRSRLAGAIVQMIFVRLIN
jgi:hypothetical protein